MAVVMLASGLPRGFTEDGRVGRVAGAYDKPMRGCALLFGAWAAMIATLVLAGWLFGVGWMRSVVPGETQMKVNAALAVLALGLALMLLAGQQWSGVRRGLGGLALAIAAATLLEWAIGVRLGIDELLAGDPSVAATSNPGRMAPNTAVCLLLCGGALLSWRAQGRWATVATWAALTAASLGFVALIGYAAGVPAYLSFNGLARMSLAAAVALSLLGVGIALASPDRGALALFSRDSPGSALARRLLPVAVVVPPILGYLRSRGQEAGLYGTSVGILLLVSAMIVVVVVATVFVARTLDRADDERRQAEVERRLQAQITTNMADGVCVVRRSDSMIVYVNARLEKMLGVATGSLVGRGNDAIQVLANRDAFVAESRDAIDRSGHWRGEVECVRADGSRFWGDIALSGFEHPQHGALSVSVISDVTARHAAAAALARQVELFDSVLRAAAEHSIIGTDLDGTITVFNTGAEQMLGYTAAQMLGLQTPAVLHDPGEVMARAAELGLEPGFEVLVHAARAGETETRAWTYLCKDGGRIQVSLTVTAMHNEHGELCGFIGIAQDITQRKAAETRLREQQRLLAESQAVGQIGSWEWDLETGTPRWSDEQFRLHGLDPAQEIPPIESYLALVHPDDQAAVRASMAAIFQRRAEFRDEYRVVLPDGATRTLLVRGDYFAPEGERPARLAGTAQDVSAERAAHAAQRTAEEQFRRSFDDALIGMMIFDLDGRYLRVNDAFCTLVGHPREQLVGLSHERITHPDDLASDAASLRALLAGETASYTREKRYIHASGEIVWAAIGVTLIHGAEGRPAHFIAQAQDITERRRHESHLKYLADHDPLTGLLNRRSFERELTSHVARVKRFGATGAVLMLDLDNFKHYNDTEGHSAGDALIVRIAHALRSRLRETDVIARLGGDEFVVLLPNEDRDSAEHVARTCSSTCAGRHPSRSASAIASPPASASRASSPTQRSPPRR